MVVLFSFLKASNSLWLYAHKLPEYLDKIATKLLNLVKECHRMNFLPKHVTSN